MPQTQGAIKLGRFEVDARIAVGGMATVYRARLTGTGGFERRFALKVIHPHLTREEGFIERFYDEARVASRIRHPNVVSTVGIESANGRTFLVLELITGVTLRQLSLKRDAVFPSPEAARLLADAARGLHAVHTVADESGTALEAIHRDISPHNIMVDAQGRALLIDLGLVKARGQLGHTQTGVLAGKLPYMSPEQSMLLPLDARSDVFSLGSVLFELVVGELPFGDDHAPDTLDRLRACDRTQLAVRLEAAHVDPWLSSVILACLHQDPAERFSSALALAEALEDELQNVGATDVEMRRWISTHARVAADALTLETHIDPAELGAQAGAGSRNGYAWGAMAVAAAAIAAFLGASAWQRTQAEPATVPDALSVDAAVDAAAPLPARTVEPSAQPVSAAPQDIEGVDTDEVDTDEVDTDGVDTDGLQESALPAPPAKRKRKRRSKPKPDAELKDNPYTQP